MADNGNARAAERVRQSLETGLNDARAYLNKQGVELDVSSIQPKLHHLRGSMEKNPFSAVFAVTLLLFAVVPVVSFIGFGLFAGSLIAGAAILFGVFWFSLVVGGAALLLLGWLSFAIAIATFVTMSAAAGAVGYRAFVNITGKGSLRAGLGATLSETKQYVRLSLSATAKSSAPFTSPYDGAIGIDGPASPASSLGFEPIQSKRLDGVIQVKEENQYQ